MELTLKEQTAKGSARLPTISEAVVYWYQVTYIDHLGKVRYLDAKSLHVDSTGIAQQTDLEDPNSMIIQFAVTDEAFRSQTIERIKALVGNPLRSSRATTSYARTTLRLAPVMNQKKFVASLKEVGEVTKIDGKLITLAVKQTAAPEVAAAPRKATEPKQPREPATRPADGVKVPAPPVADGNQVNDALSKLAGSNHFVRKKAAETLANMTPAPAQRDEVLKTLSTYLEDTDLFIRRGAVAAYANWMTAEQLDGFYPVLNDQDFVIRRSALGILGRFPCERSATEVANRLIDSTDRREAGRALRAMGVVAEAAVKQVLKNPEWMVRLEACRIIGDIGTSACLPELTALASDQNGLVRRAVSDAIVAVSSRQKKN